MLIERSIRVSGTCERFERLLIHIVHHIVVPSTTGILIVDEKFSIGCTWTVMLIERSIRVPDTCELSALWTLAPHLPPSWAHHHLSSCWHFSHTDKFVQPRNWKQFIHCHQANTKKMGSNPVCICLNFLDTSYIYCFQAVVGNMKLSVQIDWQVQVQMSTVTGTSTGTQVQVDNKNIKYFQAAMLNYSIWSSASWFVVTRQIPN